ncbi:MAG: HAD family hydrolase [Eubacteriaceae bacterium]|nr:HAD family hydrolase [Eubacteriaceae bacterium]
MEKLNNIKTIYFDYDGTLHDSIIIYVPAFRKAYEYLVSINKAEPKDFADYEIAKWLGYTDSEMWDVFMKDLEIKYRRHAEEIIAEEMAAQVRKGNARLFENITDVLKKLKEKGYVLVFLSNCGKEYMESADKIFGLNCYFDDMVCSGIYDNKPKHEILSEIKNKYPLNQVMIGDRFHDIKTAQSNNIYSIFCEYGYGDAVEGKDATVRIRKPIEILNYL